MANKVQHLIGTDGTPITIANSTAGGDAVASVNGPTPPIYSAAAAYRGVTGMRAQAVAAADICSIGIGGGSGLNASDRFMFRTPANDGTLYKIHQARTSVGAAAALGIDTDQKIAVSASGGGTVTKGTVALVAGTWYRCHKRIFSDAASGTARYDIFTADSLTQLDSVALTGQNTRGGLITNNLYGKISGTQTGPIDIDEIQIVDSGLVVVGPAPLADAGQVQINVNPYDRGVLTVITLDPSLSTDNPDTYNSINMLSGTLTYLWTQLTGATVTYVNGTSATSKYPQFTVLPKWDGTTVTFSLQVFTTALYSSDFANTSVQIRAHTSFLANGTPISSLSLANAQ